MAEQDNKSWEEFKKKAGSVLKQSVDIRKMAEKYSELAKKRADEAAEAAAKNSYETVAVPDGPGSQSIEEQFPETRFNVRGGAHYGMDSAPEFQQINHEGFQGSSGYFKNSGFPNRKSHLFRLKYSSNENPVLFRKAR